MVDATRDLILNCDDLALVKLTVPYWKDKEGNCIDVYVKQLSGKEAEAYTEATDEGKKNRNAHAIIASVCDKNGNKLFTKQDVDALNNKNSNIINWLVTEILKINFKSVDDVEEKAKNS